MPSKKNGQVILYGEGNNEAIKAAISLARKYRYVYLCTPEFRLSGTEELQNRLQRHKNIVHLPNTNIKSCKRDKNSEASEVVLDTYNIIHADAILMLLGREGDASPLNKRMVEVDAQNKILVKSCNETTLVPNIFAIGDCAQSQSSMSAKQIINTIITRLKLS
jgi:thioredoxin reductase